MGLFIMFLFIIINYLFYALSFLSFPYYFLFYLHPAHFRATLKRQVVFSSLREEITLLSAGSDRQRRAPGVHSQRSSCPPSPRGHPTPPLSRSVGAEPGGGGGCSVPGGLEPVGDRSLFTRVSRASFGRKDTRSPFGSRGAWVPGHLQRLKFEDTQVPCTKQREVFASSVTPSPEDWPLLMQERRRETLSHCAIQGVAREAVRGDRGGASVAERTLSTCGP